MMMMTHDTTIRETIHRLFQLQLQVELLTRRNYSVFISHRKRQL